MEIDYSCNQGVTNNLNKFLVTENNLDNIIDAIFLFICSQTETHLSNPVLLLSYYLVSAFGMLIKWYGMYLLKRTYSNLRKKY